MEFITIKDVAKESGYSITTVSRVLSGSDYPVSADARNAIEQCARSLGYVPNQLARSLKTSSSTEIAVITPSLRNPYYTTLITSIENTLSLQGYNMLVYLRKRYSVNVQELIANLTSKMVAGVIIATDCINTKMAKGLRELKARKIPVIVFDDAVDGFSDLRGVFFDYHRGGRCAAQTLYQHGHKDVALITLDYTDEATRRSYVGGFCEFFREVGCPLREDRDIFKSSEADDFTAGMALADSVLNARKKYTAIAANNDSVAAGALSAMMLRGVNVPESISIIGMDDNIYARMTTPRLTTVHVPAAEMGKLAAKYLLEEISGFPLEFSIYMQSDVIIRQTIINNYTQEETGENGMHLYVNETKQDLGCAAAKLIAEKINEAIKEKGYARIMLSTGASQFETLEALVKEDVDWSKVTMFHLDEYVNLPVTHKASFRKYLTERFVDLVHPKEACFVNGVGDVEANIAALTERLTELPIDVGVIGIGENSHIAFNDPPADFETKESYIVVNLNERCKKQQVGEGWFATVDDVPEQAVTITCYRIMQCKCIVAPVPKAVKAEAVAAVLRSETTNPMIPGTLLKTHSDFHLFVDKDSASLCDEELLAKYR
jgi:DNA-binding LacI/PurR family transcriptional regulator/6-phosphogluconolactonase/glucosamine-6-phosphate isomerase/deaminase